MTAQAADVDLDNIGVPMKRPRRRMARGLSRGGLLFAAVALVAAAVMIARPKVRLGAEAYVFGYPLVVMDVTREHSALSIGPENRLLRVRKFPDAAFRAVVRPNVDTLYTTAFIDMSRGPWVFEMAPNSERFETMPFLDGWTNVFAAPGWRTTGKGGGGFLLAGPEWSGEIPPGLQLLRSPTRIVWLIGRTQTDGASDYPLVHRLQDGLRLRTLAEWRSGVPESEPAWRPAETPPPAPADRMRDMPVDEFFDRLAQLMVDNPPAPADAPMLEKLAAIGVRPGKVPQWNTLDRLAVALGRLLADRKIAEALAEPAGLVNGWATPPASLGAYGTDYATRAAVAIVGLGANLPADSTYPNTRLDATGAPLDGRHRYRLHFAAGQLPPVDAFWSVTAYGADNFLIDHPAQRFALGDRDPLARNADGSVDLWIQADPPPEPRRTNWLPVKAGEPFLLNARLYWPRPEALDGRWSMPPVERVD